ncbi:MAG TPA: MFS transporter [Candidatus Saccharimonadales bacterium]|nr:MFS transporter [Candidatus Saccharimonadales bacterium]
MEPESIVEPPGRARQALGATFSSLKHRNFRLYFSGQIVSNTGNWLTNVALTLLVLHLTHSGLAVGILAACQFGPILLLSIWAGAIADRSDKRRLLLLTQSLEMAESIGLAILAFLPHPPLAGLYALAVAGGTFLAFDNPLRRSFVSEMVPAGDVPNAVVLYSTIVNLSRIFGPSLAGLLVVTVGYGWCFSVDAASYLAVLVCLLMMRASELHRRPPAERAKGEVRAGLRYVLSQPKLWINFLMLLIIGILAYNFGVTLPLFVTDGLHKANTTYTVLYSIMSVGSVVTALIVAHRGFVKLRHVIWGAGALGVAMLVLSAAQSVAVAAAVAFFVGAASILYTTSTTALVQIEARPDMRGRVLALQTVLLIGTTPLGGPLLGWLADSRGGRAPLVLGGLASLVAAGLGYGITRLYRQRARAAS